MVKKLIGGFAVDPPDVHPDENNYGLAMTASGSNRAVKKRRVGGS